METLAFLFLLYSRDKCLQELFKINIPPTILRLKEYSRFKKRSLNHSQKTKQLNLDKYFSIISPVRILAKLKFPNNSDLSNPTW